MIEFPFKLFYGTVEDINDPLETDRVRVRCYGIHTEIKSLLKTEDLPWATLAKPVTSASTSGVGSSHGLVKGSDVIGYFRDGDLCQDPVVMFTYTGIPISKSNVNKGFNDPTGEFPRYINESDVNRLARNKNIEETIVDVKTKSIEKNIKTANGVVWNETDNPYNTTYPLNKVYESISGHIIEIDDTPDNERINIHHKSGSYVEMYPDGTIVSKCKGSLYSVTEIDNNVLIKGQCNITVVGDANIKCDNANVECNKSFVKAIEEYLVETKIFKVVASVKALFETPLVEGTGEVKDSVRTMQGDRDIYNTHTHSISNHTTAIATNNTQ